MDTLTGLAALTLATGAAVPADEPILDAPTLDALTTLSWTVAGAAVGLVAAAFSLLLLRRLGRFNRLTGFLYQRSRTPCLVVGALIGTLIGLGWAGFGVDVSSNTTYALAWRLFIIALVGCITWWVASLCLLIDDITQARYAGSAEGRSRRLTTQAQVLRRVLQAIVIITGVVVALLTFPSARGALGSMLASAGVVSLIAGLAAQSILANMFAGMQIAFSDSVRVGDMVVVDGQQGTIEEITLTYVVLHCWDERRVILPSKRFTSDSFENWTRRNLDLQGTVELQLDWRTPMPLFRATAERLVQANPHWDGRSFDVQMTEATAQYVLVRLVVSAASPGDLWQLRCDLREQMVAWVQADCPAALPLYRLEQAPAVPEPTPVPDSLNVLLAEGPAPASPPNLDAAGQSKSEPQATSVGDRASAIKAKKDKTSSPSKTARARRATSHMLRRIRKPHQ